MARRPGTAIWTEGGERCAREFWPAMVLCVGCGARTELWPLDEDASVDDGAAVMDALTVTDVVTLDAVALPDRAAPDAPRVDAGRDAGFDAGRDVSPPGDRPEPPRCDPSALADAGPDDAGTPAGRYVVELSNIDILHQCALMDDATVRCRGSNGAGQLGVESPVDWSEEPLEVDGLSDVAQVVAAEIDTTCARLRDGTVRCWGSNQYNGLGTGHAGDETCARFGSAQPCRRRPTPVPGLTDVVFLAPAMFAMCAVRASGEVWCWGSTDPLLPSGGSPTPVRVARLSDVVWMQSMLYGWVVRHRDGRYEPVGVFDPISVPAGAELAEGAGNNHVCYRLPDTSMRCVGVNANGKLGGGTSRYPGAVTEPVNPGLCGVRSAAVGGYHTCAVLADRSVSCWGDGHFDGRDATELERCVGINQPTMCLTRPTPVPGLTQAARLFTGTWSTCALRTDHSLWCWGRESPNADESPGPVTW